MLSREYQQRRIQLKTDAVQTARALSQTVDSYLLRAETVAVTLSVSESLARRDFASFHRNAREVVAVEKLGINIALLDESGQQIVNTLQEPGTSLPRTGNPELIRRVVETGKAEISNLFIGGIIRQPLMVVAVPVIQDGRTRFVLVVSIRPDQFTEMLLKQGLPEGRIAAVFDGQGTIAGRTHAAEKHVGKQATESFLQKIRQAREGSFESTNLDGTPVLVAYSVSPTTRWGVSIGIPRQTLEAELDRTLLVISLGLIGVFGLGLGLAWLMGARIAQSVLALRVPAKALSTANPGLTPPIHLREVEEVAGAMEDAARLLADRAEEVQRQEAELVERSAALRDSEKKLHFFTEHAPAAIAVFDQDMRYLAVSRRWTEDFGKGEGQLIGRSHYDLYPDLPAAWIEAHRRGLAGQVVGVGADRFDCVDGSERWIRWDLWPWHLDSGAVGGIVMVVEDVTERREAEEQVRSSEEKYRTLFSNMSEGFALGELIHDDQGLPADLRILEANEAFYQQTGLPKGIVGRPAREYLPGLEQSWLDYYHTVIGTGEARRLENFNADTGRHYDLRAFRPSPGRFAVLFRDVTEEIQIQRQLVESESYLRQLIATLPGMVWTATPTGEIDFFSPQWLSYTGTTLESQLGTGFLESVHPEDRDYLCELRRECLAGQGEFHGEYRLRRHDGTYGWVKSRATLLLDPQGRVSRWLGVVVDIDDLKRAQAALHESNARFQAVFEQAAVGIARVALSGRWLQVNEGLCAILGYDRQEMLARKSQDMTYPPDLEADLVVARRLVAGEIASCTLEKRYMSKGGSPVWINMTVSLVRKSGGKPDYFIVVLEDIQAHKEAEAALESARQSHLRHLEQQVAERTAALQAAHDHLEERVAQRTEQVRRLAAEVTFAEERERQALARDLHDDLGQLLHIVKIKLGLLTRESLPPRGQALAEESSSLISSASRKVRSLTSQLSPPVLSTLGLPAALRWLCSEIEETYGLSVSCKAETLDYDLTTAQSAILYRAARELLINAAKHSGSRIAALELARREGSLMMTVVDYGNGIQVLEEALNGTNGFGLTSVRERISFLGGTTIFRTPPSGGLQIVLTLPLEKMAQAESPCSS